MAPSTVGPPFDQFLATAEAVAQARPGVDPELAREVFHEVATLLYDGLALDGLDEHDAAAVVAGLCVDLVVEDPGAAERARRAHRHARGERRERGWSATSCVVGSVASTARRMAREPAIADEVGRT